jgi:hypothetical protein
MLGGESQLVNWVRAPGVHITHWIAEAMAILKINKENWCEADISRTAGEIALNTRGRNAVSAETHFNHSLEVARRQQTKSLELRAAMSLTAPP